jgi:regulator of replication initiation timing
MPRPNDREFALKRKIKDLEEQNGRMEVEIRNLKKQIDRSTPEEEKIAKKKKVIDHPCPDCGAATKTITLPNALLDVCVKVCGWKKIR